MKICNFDLIILVILMFIVNFFYDTIKKYFNIKEGFDATSDMKAVIGQVYNADIEAIRNLSSIASQLTTGGLTIPGKLNLPNNTSLSADGDDATHWLRLRQTNNPEQYKSFAAQDLWCAQGTLTSGVLNNSGNATVGGTLNIGGLITSNNQGFMYLYMKLGGSYHSPILDQNNNKLSFNNWVVHANFYHIENNNWAGAMPYVGTDNNWWVLNPYSGNFNHINLLCIPKNWFSYVSKPNNLYGSVTNTNGGRIFYKQDGSTQTTKGFNIPKIF